MVEAALCSPTFLLMHDLECNPRRRVAESTSSRNTLVTHVDRDDRTIQRWALSDNVDIESSAQRSVCIMEAPPMARIRASMSITVSLLGTIRGGGCLTLWRCSSEFESNIEQNSELESRHRSLRLSSPSLSQLPAERTEPGCRTSLKKQRRLWTISPTGTSTLPVRYLCLFMSLSRKFDWSLIGKTRMPVMPPMGLA